MFEGIPAAFLNGISVVTLCVLAAYCFMKGLIVPRKTHEDVIDDRNQWRTMALELKAENTRLLLVSELGVNAIRAIEEKAGVANGGGS